MDNQDNEPKSKLQADLEKKEPEASAFKMPVKGLPSRQSAKTVLNTADQRSDAEVASVMADFERISNELKTAAEKAALKRAGEIPPGTAGKRKIALSLNEQPVSQDVSTAITQLTEKAALKHKRSEPAASDALDSNLTVQNTPVVKTARGAAARRPIPLSTDEQPISFELAAAITKLKNSMGLSSFDRTEQPVSAEVQIGEKTRPKPALKPTDELEPNEPLPQRTAPVSTGPRSLSLQTRPEMERAPQKKMKGGPRLAGKDPEKVKARENTELIKGANVKLKACPRCKTETGQETLLCNECGYNFETGRTQMTPAKKKQIRLRCELAFWITLIALALTARLRPQEARRLYRATLEPYLSPIYATYIRPYLTGEHDPELQSWLLEQTGREMPATPATPPEKKPRRNADFAAIEADVKAVIDLKYPMLKAGDEAVFITTDNQSATALFIGVENGQIILELNGKQTRGPVTKLAPSVRLRVDPEYRREHIRKKVAQQIEESQSL